ncbi:MAG: thiamine phosphate synthase [Thermoanaerobaculia bacterium]
MPSASPGSIPKLYALADWEALEGTSLAEAACRMADAGVRWIQIRAKNVGDDELAAGVEDCCRALEGSEAELWLNDRPDLARMFPVRGVHLGQDDLAPAAARPFLGESSWIGLSTHGRGQVEEADADPAVDVVAIGPVFDTTGKKNPEPVIGLDGVRRARAATGKPLVAIGGIDRGRIREVLAAGADSVAILSAICRGSIERNCRRLVALAEATV